MPTSFRPVYSSHITQIGYNSDTKEMVVRYKKGKPSLYSEITPEDYQAITQSASIGSAIHANIRGKRPHKYVEP
jgi:hypothetical protein